MKTSDLRTQLLAVALSSDGDSRERVLVDALDVVTSNEVLNDDAQRLLLTAVLAKMGNGEDSSITNEAESKKPLTSHLLYHNHVIASHRLSLLHGATLAVQSAAIDWSAFKISFDWNPHKLSNFTSLNWARANLRTKVTALKLVQFRQSAVLGLLVTQLHKIKENNTTNNDLNVAPLKSLELLEKVSTLLSSLDQDAHTTAASSFLYPHSQPVFENLDLDSLLTFSSRPATPATPGTNQKASIAKSTSFHPSSDMRSCYVVDFAKDHGVKKVGLDSLGEIRKAVQRGDLSVILKSYEEDLKAPLSAAVKGDLICSLLIQVQKSKVDLELVMSSLDKLLQANELNFTIMSVPILFISFGTYPYIRTWIRKRSGVSREQVYEKIRVSLGDVERLLNRANMFGADAASEVGGKGELQGLSFAD
ncbi:UNVERIFIED_CONTAM: Nuclear control of ATPase protein 2 [Siphonaria sp. JEL0065]|nr:Nuclear control of ATPase protein 2 [Siphonaria sp. JEL0065]